jgi:hypothetical protein
LQIESELNQNPVLKGIPLKKVHGDPGTTSTKSLKQKNSDKNCIPGDVFSLYFLLQDFPPTMMPFLLTLKKYQKSENLGHMRPDPWKSSHHGE